MELLRLGPVGGERPAVRHDDVVHDLSSLTDDITPAFLAADGIARTRAALEADHLAVLDVAPGTRIGAPVTRPPKVVCIGLNYSDHAAESGMDLPSEPVVFMKAANTVVGPNDDVRIPRGSERTDYEVELGVVVGREARYLDAPADAAACIAGYAVSHDVSERRYQLELGGQWVKGKSCETFNPLGPWLVPADEVDVSDLGLRLSVNGELRQDGSTRHLVFGVEHVVWYLSQFMVLEPGDLINTGTPAGVALGSDDIPYLTAGDVVELSIDGLGTQRQEFVPAP